MFSKQEEHIERPQIIELLKPSSQSVSLHFVCSGKFYAIISTNSVEKIIFVMVMWIIK